MFLDLTLLAIVLAVCSGLAGLFLPRSTAWGERIAAAFMVFAAIAGLAGAAGGLCGRSAAAGFFPWPAAGHGAVGLDPLSAFFLVPVYLMGGLGPLYGLGYWPQRRHPGNGRKLRLFWGLMVAGMGLLIISRHGLIFLLGWEFMALSAFFLVTTEDFRAESCQAGWVYLIAAHVGTLTLFALFALWRHATGSYLLQPAGQDLSLGVMNLFFVLALLGFGLKTGVMPLHFWLPGAHANAPSHVSAMLSGVVLKTGIYGLVRWLSLLPDPPAAWGGFLLALGAVSGLLGVVFAIGQHDLKRLLAYHSVENIGIILMGLGVALLGRSAGCPEWTVLGLAGCLLHVWNHSFFKSLLFLCAGAVVHATRTRQIDRLGGIAKAMPWTAAFFLTGAVAICGLPPLNGFVSEWLVYLGLLKGALAPESSGMAALIGVPVLAMTGALAVACFVKVYGAVFLGEPRTRAARRAREVPFVMRLPMGVLASCCALIGFAPLLVAPALDAAVACWLATERGGLPLAGIVPLGRVSVMAASLTVCAAGLTALLVRRAAAPRSGLTWDCGYAAPSGRMQYTAGSFAQSIVLLFRGVLRPQGRLPHLTRLFPEKTHFHSHVDDAVLDRVLLPGGRHIEAGFAWLHRFQRGLTQHYLLYLLLTLLAFLCSLFSFRQFVAQWFTR
ncbi:MAG: proton-conducting transporter membrane subunit [Kiritimatiellia bacterium]|jgi:hydrogenase-4 component B|nr:proton-conducting transporter membrane subunit [Kiritimatiellia bacterium]